MEVIKFMKFVNLKECGILKFQKQGQLSGIVIKQREFESNEEKNFSGINCTKWSQMSDNKPTISFGRDQLNNGLVFYFKIYRYQV